MRVRTLVGICLISLLVASPAAAFRNVAPGSAIENPALTAVDGLVQPLLPGARGEPTVVLFWASWSPRSLEALADLQRLYAAEGLQVAAVSVETESPDEGDLSAIRNVLQRQGVRFPVFVDRGLELYQGWGVVAVPSAALVDAAGRVIAVMDGYAPGQRKQFLAHARAAAVAATQRYSAAPPATTIDPRAN